jgi:large exoprotein involved in heme utilization and adhesion
MVGGSVLSRSLGGGDPGSIQIAADTIDLSNGAFIGSQALGSGNGGNVDLIADAVRLIDFSGVGASALFGSLGTAGSVSIDTQTLDVVNASFVQAFSSGAGDAGNVAIRASEYVAVSGTAGQFTGIFANTFGEGNAGTLSIESPRLTLSSAGSLQSSTFQESGGGRGGVIDIDVGTLVIEGGQGAGVPNGSLIGAISFGDGHGGQIDITADDIFLSGDLGSTDGIVASAVQDGDGGSIIINTTNLTLNDGAFISTNSWFGTGDSGRIDIVADGTIHLSAYQDFNTGIFNNTFAQGNAGGISVTSDVLRIGGFAGVQAATAGGSTGDGGSIKVSVNELSTFDGGSIIALSFGTGVAGSIDIDARGSVDLEGIGSKGFGSLSTTTSGPGAGGSISVDSQSLSIRNGATIAVSSFGAGTAGAVRLDVSDRIVVEGRSADETSSSSIESASFGSLGGGAGTIDVNAGALTLEGGGQIRASTESDRIDNARATITIGVERDVDIVGPAGDEATASGIFAETSGASAAGDVNIDAASLTMSGGVIRTDTLGAGQGGDVRIVSSGFVDVRDGATIRSTATASGDSGNVSIDAESIEIRGGIVNTSAASDGDGGRIRLLAPMIELTDGALIASTSSGAGAAGNVELSGGVLEMTAGATLSSNAELSSGGEIDLQFTKQIRLVDSIVSAAAFGVTPDADGGNVTIDPEFFILNRSDVLANANAGNGGNIFIRADYLFVDAESLIDASSRTGVDGQVQLESPNDLTNTVAEIETPSFEGAELVRNACAARALQERSSMVVRRSTARGTRPDSYLEAPETDGKHEPSSGALTTLGCAR